jgi:uncharacterized membrane protein YphA (DoxX/SURF4 family)
MSVEIQYPVLRLAIAAILLWAGIAKVVRFKNFVSTVRVVPITPRGVSVPVAWLVVASEISIGTLLTLDVGTQVAAVGGSVAGNLRRVESRMTTVYARAAIVCAKV